MPQLPIVPLGDSAAVVLPASVLESVGLRIGDVVDVTVGDRQLILQPAAGRTPWTATWSRKTTAGSS